MEGSVASAAFAGSDPRPYSLVPIALRRHDGSGVVVPGPLGPVTATALRV